MCASVSTPRASSQPRSSQRRKITRRQVNAILQVTQTIGELYRDEDDEEQFQLNDYAQESIRELQRALKRDSPGGRPIFSLLSKFRVVQESILPIFVHCRDDNKLVFDAAKLLVLMTLPPEEHREVPETDFEYLREHRKAFLGRGVIDSVTEYLIDSFMAIEKSVNEYEVRQNAKKRLDERRKASQMRALQRSLEDENNSQHLNPVEDGESEAEFVSEPIDSLRQHSSESTMNQSDDVSGAVPFSTDENSSKSIQSSLRAASCDISVTEEDVVARSPTLQGNNEISSEDEENQEEDESDGEEELSGIVETEEDNDEDIEDEEEDEEDEIHPLDSLDPTHVNFLELILTIFINLLKIPPSKTEIAGEEPVLRVFQQKHVLDCVLLLSNHASYFRTAKHLDFLLCELVFLLVHEINPRVVCKSYRLQQEEAQSSNLLNGDEEYSHERASRVHLDPELVARLKEYKSMKKAKRAASSGSASFFPRRHSRFGGVYLAKSENFKGKEIRVMHPDRKVERKKKFNRRKLVGNVDDTSAIKAPHDLRFLFDFSKSFLTSCFSNLIAVIGRDIETGSVDTLESDVEHYCGMIAYFVHFYMILVQNEVIAVSPCLVAPIFNVEMFDFNFQRIMHCIGQSMWKSIDVHVSLLNALFRLVNFLSTSSDRDLSILADGIRLNVLHQAGYLSLIPELVRDRRLDQHCPRYLFDVISLADTVLSSLDALSGRTGRFFVQVRRKKRHSSKSKGESGSSERGPTEAVSEQVPPSNSSLSLETDSNNNTPPVPANEPISLLDPDRSDSLEKRDSLEKEDQTETSSSDISTQKEFSSVDDSQLAVNGTDTASISGLSSAVPDLQAPLLQSESVDQRIFPTTSAIDQPADQVHDQNSNTPDSDAEDQYEDAEQEFRVSRWFRLLAHADAFANLRRAFLIYGTQRYEVVEYIARLMIRLMENEFADGFFEISWLQVIYNFLSSSENQRIWRLRSSRARSSEIAVSRFFDSALQVLDLYLNRVRNNPLIFLYSLFPRSLPHAMLGDEYLRLDETRPPRDGGISSSDEEKEADLSGTKNAGGEMQVDNSSLPVSKRSSRKQTDSIANQHKEISNSSSEDENEWNERLPVHETPSSDSERKEFCDQVADFEALLQLFEPPPVGVRWMSECLRLASSEISSNQLASAMYIQAVELSLESGSFTSMQINSILKDSSFTRFLFECGWTRTPLPSGKFDSPVIPRGTSSSVLSELSSSALSYVSNLEMDVMDSISSRPASPNSSPQRPFPSLMVGDDSLSEGAEPALSSAYPSPSRKKGRKMIRTKRRLSQRISSGSESSTSDVDIAAKRKNPDSIS